MTHSAFAETALVKLAAPGLFNDVGCKRCPHEFLLLVRKARPARLDGLPRRIECGEENGHGLRIKDAGLYVTVEEVAHFARPGFMLGARCRAARSAPYISSAAGAWRNIAWPFGRERSTEVLMGIGGRSPWIIVRHEPNLPSGGQVADIEIGAFLIAAGNGTEKQELLRLIATLVQGA